MGNVSPSLSLSASLAVKMQSHLPTGSEFADLHPSAEVIGTDLSPIQPQFIPPNLTFEVDDCCDEWIYKNKFDFIHVRGLYGCVADWSEFYKDAYKYAYTFL